MASKCVVHLEPGFRPKTFVKEAIEKYENMFSTKLVFLHAKSANDVGAMLAGGRVIDVIVVNKVLEIHEVNAFHASFKKYEGELPLLIVASEQQGLLGHKFTGEGIIFNAVMDKDFIFDCLRLYVADTDRKVDMRIFREILISVVDVIYQNTKEKLVPGKVAESKAAEVVEDVSGVLAFFGEGIKGTLLIGTSMELLQNFASKMLFCEVDDLTEDMLVDVMGEISNQVLGIVRNALSEYGYVLNSSMQIVVTGMAHDSHTRTSGHYYVLPFSFGDLDFRVTFCYDTYAIKLNRGKMLEEKKQRRVLDVRLLNSIIKIVPQVILANTRIKVWRTSIEPMKTMEYFTHALHVIHGRSEQGGFLIALDISDSVGRKISSKMLYCEESDVTQSMIVDALGELINQVQGGQKKTSAKYGYDFQNIFHCSFASLDSVHYLMKNPGHYCRITFESAEGHRFICCFGMDSFYAQNILDAADIIKAFDEFVLS